MQLEVSDLVFSYGEADVLKSVSFCADRGERIAVLGPNGVGKSTLFRCLLGFLEPKRGSVKIAGRDVRDYSRRALAAELAYIPQSYSPAFDHTVLDSVLMGLGAQLGPFDRPSREPDERSAADSGRAWHRRAGFARVYAHLRRRTAADAARPGADPERAHAHHGRADGES